MPVMLTERPTPYEDIPNRIRWTRQECDAMRDAGFLTERYELIDGEILSKMGQKPQHAFIVNLLMAWLVNLFGAEYVRIQSTIDLSAVSPQYDEPEPDAAVTVQPSSAYADHHPGPADLLLIFEVSDTTLRFDRSTKAALYGRAGIREYWILDVAARQILVHRQHTPEGYADITAYHADEEVAAAARPDMPIRVATLLP